MTPHEQDLNELIAVLNTRLEGRHLEATQQSREIGDLKRELAEAREERDLAIAHDRQPYPTAWAYDQACKALEDHRQRADTALAALADAEADRDRARDIAVALEQENARLTEELGQLRLDDEIEQRATALSPSDFDEPF